MRAISTTAFAAALMSAAVPFSPAADLKAELVSPAVIWGGEVRTAADVVRFNDRWVLVTVEGTNEYANDAALRILTSVDAMKWESVALLKNPTATRGLHQPKFMTGSDRELMLTAQGIVADPGSTDPLPRFGGTVKTMASLSKDGRTWGAIEPIGVANYQLNRAVRHKGVAYTMAHGLICGSATTIRFYATEEVRGLERLYEKTFSDFPTDSAVAFDGDVAHCVMSRGSRNGSSTVIEGQHGTAKPPYNRWEWKEMDSRISYPNLIQLPGGRIVAAVGFHDPKPRTSLCEFDPTTGKLKEFLKLPTGDAVREVGLAVHDGNLWVSYPSSSNGKESVQLAKVAMK